MKLSRKARRSVEIFANIAIVLVAVVIIGNFFWSRIHPRQKPAGPVVGSVVSLAGVNWQANGNTLLLVLQEGCRYCEESAPFYRKLHEQRAGLQPRMLTVIPGEATESTHYLSDRQLPTDGIINAQLTDLNVTATPTLLLVDETGHVKAVWIGKLDETRQREVRQKAFGID
jgi:hypothetical protein